MVGDGTMVNLSFVITSLLVIPTFASLSYTTCDSYSVPSSTKANNLVPNTLHKLCPGVPNSQQVGGLDYPACGDGTPFSFFFSRPTQRKMNSDKILIEFMGGGACWDEDTCEQMADYLTFPSKLDSAVGLSCSEINAGQGDAQFNLLCAQSDVGGVDFTQYNTIIVPYCTQDVHLGSKSMTYDDGSTINHVGGANTMAVLNWVFENFPNPSHILLTGCSAGGTALPMVYDILNMHYNRWTHSPPGIKSVQISTVADSAVYLTPACFLENAFQNWDPTPMMEKLNFPFDTYKNDENYSNQVWNHVMKRGPNSDKWGFITHNDDPVSQMYYSRMGGSYADDDAYNGQQLEDVADEWWELMSYSLATAKEKHKNLDTFIIDGQGHCTFGWYYAMQEDGFDDWVKKIVQERPVLGRTNPSAPLFAVAAIVGALIAFGAIKGRKTRDIAVDDGYLLNESGKKKSASQIFYSCFGVFLGFCSRFNKCPVTAGYFAAVAVYFVTMIISEGFSHPIDNPSLGPDADSLSSFGINNPTIIVFKSQLFRLVTSGFLCSGVLTFVTVALTLIRQTRHLEREIGNTKLFLILGTTIMLGSNLIYACVAQGATCSTIATILGMNTLSIVISKKMSTSETTFLPRAICSTTTTFIYASLIFPFNSWIINLAGVCIGLFLGCIVLERSESDIVSDPKTDQSRYTAKRGPLGGFLAVCLLMLFLLVFRVIRPNKLYMSPFLTGCDLTHVELQADIVGSLYENRRLEEDDDGTLICAEFCVPHIAARPLVWGANTYSGYSVSTGQCQDVGYDTHVADKTFTRATYSVDVEIFTASSN